MAIVWDGGVYAISSGMLSLFMAFCSWLDEQICYWSSHPNVHPCH